MDNKLIKQYGEDILCYRLLTARQKKRMQYKDFDRQLIALHKEEKALYEQRRNLGWEPLMPPVQKGWKRLFVLREDIARGRHGAFFENILAKINTKDWSHRKDFHVKKRKRGRKIHVVKEQKLVQHDAYQFAKLDLTEMEKKFFHAEYHFEKWRKEPVLKYVFNEPWRFVLRVRPNMIDKVRARDGVMEARISEIDNYLERNDYRNRQARLLYGRSKCKCWDRGEKYNVKNVFKGMSPQEILDHVENEIL